MIRSIKTDKMSTNRGSITSSTQRFRIRLIEDSNLSILFHPCFCEKAMISSSVGAASRIHIKNAKIEIKAVRGAVDSSSSLTYESGTGNDSKDTVSNQIRRIREDVHVLDVKGH